MTAVAQTMKIGEWVLRVRKPQGDGPHPVMLLIHGWTGDEESMWIFAPRLPKDVLMIAPRGLHPSPTGGYGWHPHHANGWPSVDDFRPAVEALLSLLRVENFPEADFSQIQLVGFSQGAALVYTYSLLHPDGVRSLAGLSGFLPRDAGDIIRARPLAGKQVFVAHGSRDVLVDVERARQAVDMLQKAGASVTYCEDEVGHKLSLNCFRGLETFFTKH